MPSATEHAGGGRARRILVMKFRSPGDVLLMVPALKALKRRFPEAALTVAVNAEAASLIDRHPAVAEVLPYDRAGARGATALGRARIELNLVRRVRAGNFDIAVNATEGDRGALLALASGAPVRVGLNQAGSGLKTLKHHLFTHLLAGWPRGRHNVRCNLDLVALLGAASDDHRVELALTAQDAATVEALLAEGGIEPAQPLVHVHAPSRVPYKCWTPRGMAAAVDHLELERSVRVALSGAPAERPYVEAIAGLCRSRPVNLAGRLSLRQVGALARRASLFFGVDTVAMHLAAAVGTPVVALFGPSIAAGWGPWDNDGPEVQYPAPRGVQTSGPHVVFQPERDCVPCGNMGCHRSGRSACLAELEAAEVIPVLDEALGRALRAGGHGC